ncbi:hypothetical protein [Enterobacter sp. KBR-315C3_2022]|uniref:hypothetical protein n=1 Tax=Enterobacter sp. KBR-315C3_2022 TaxID=3242494 RepID=UPI003526D906
MYIYRQKQVNHKNLTCRLSQFHANGNSPLTAEFSPAKIAIPDTIRLTSKNYRTPVRDEIFSSYLMVIISRALLAMLIGFSA